jgi:adenylosuccinate synthase
VRRTLKPVYENFSGWSEDVSKIRHFAELPKNAQRYVAAMMRRLLDVAYEGSPWPSADKLPNLRYLGVGPEPSQIIKDVPATATLVQAG